MNRYIGGFRKAALAVLFLTLSIGCKKEDFALVFSHQQHVVENEVECSVCHQTANGGMSMPGHEVCSDCHEIDADNASAECLMCHKAKSPSEIQAGYSAMAAEAKDNDIVFSHETHTYMDAGCETCHARIPRTTSAADSKLPPLETCLGCHNDRTAPLEDCSLCHEPSSPRSEERRVGKECRSRWSPYH